MHVIPSESFIAFVPHVGEWAGSNYELLIKSRL